jgi:hypothetical protein
MVFGFASQLSKKTRQKGVVVKTVPRRMLMHTFSCTGEEFDWLIAAGIVVQVAPASFAFDDSVRNYVRHLRMRATERGPSGSNLGELVAVADVRARWEPIIRSVRQMILGLPSAMAFEIPTLTPADRAVLEKICRDALEEAANGVGFEIPDPPDEERDDG